MRAAAFALLLALGATAHASSLRLCDRPLELAAPQKDKLFRLSAVIKDELERSGQRIALMSRSGLDLARFGQRYSHAGFSLKANPDTPWAVRQLYYACDEERPRIFDQGVAGFVLGTDDPKVGYISIVFVADEAAASLERAALDNRQALALLSPVYSANAYPFSQQFQNCNQWVAEMLAAAWGAVPGDGVTGSRANAQVWLKEQGYQPTRFDGSNRLLMALTTAFVPWLHSDDHPRADLSEAQYRVSMPASIEAFVRQSAPAAKRVELCHSEQHIVVRRNSWEPIAEGCVPGDADTVIRY